MPAPVQWHFGSFRLDPAHACVWHGEDARLLSPKVLAVLQYLVRHPDRLVTKDELLDAVWPATAVSDAVVRIAIGTLRKILGDPVHTPQYIATVPGHGYRFLAPVTVTPVALAALSASVSPNAAPAVFVEREALLQHLQQALSAAEQGRRQVVVLSGEPGVGKTALVEMFLAQVADTAAWVAVGQCVESYGTDEAYLPVLEAIGQLCRGPDRTRLVGLLEQYAPTWLLQLPWLLRPSRRVQLHAELQGTTRERMLREGADVLDILTAEQPLVLVLEDLHWSDAATLDLLRLVARRRTPARLLLLGTVRPGEMPMASPPRQRLLADLQRSRAVTLLPVPLLSADAVATYLARRFPQQCVPGTLAAWLHQHTDGHPFFLVTLVQTLLDQRVLYEHQGCWRIQDDLAAHAATIPTRLSAVLDQHHTRLAPAHQRVLEVASVAGVEFAAAAVAAGVEAPGEVVEAHCDALVAQQQLYALGVTTWPNGIVTSGYRFRHALVQQALYARLGAGQRVRLHQRLGACLEAAYGTHVGEIAAALADHFARGGDTPRAVAYLHLAAEKAAQRFAHREVIVLLRRALLLLAQLPKTPARIQHELAIQMTLGPALIATQGQAAAEVAQTYARAHLLCHQVPESPQLAQTLMGLSHFALVQGAHPTAHATGQHLLRVAERLADPVARLSAHATLGLTAMYLGDLGGSRTHLAQGLGLADGESPRPRALHALLDFGVVCRNGLAAVVQQLGYPAQAQQYEQETLALTQALASPFNRCNMLLFLALGPLFRREGHRAQPWVEDALLLATTHGFRLYAVLGQMVRGATCIVQGEGQEGVRHLRQGLGACQALGAKVLHPWGLAMLAEGYAGLGQPAAGLRALAQAQTLLVTTRAMMYAAEITRLQGELGLQRHGHSPTLEPAPASTTAAETCFQQALAIARGQQARWWELRAALSLARLWQQQGKCAEAYALLAPVYGWFTEGFDTADLQEAKTLLEELGA